MVDHEWNAKVNAGAQALQMVSESEVVLVIAIKKLDNPKDVEVCITGAGTTRKARNMTPRMIDELGAYMAMTRTKGYRGFQEN